MLVNIDKFKTPDKMLKHLREVFETHTYGSHNFIIVSSLDKSKITVPLIRDVSFQHLGRHLIGIRCDDAMLMNLSQDVLQYTKYEENRNYAQFKVSRFKITNIHNQFVRKANPFTAYAYDFEHLYLFLRLFIRSGKNQYLEGRCDFNHNGNKHECSSILTRRSAKYKVEIKVEQKSDNNIERLEQGRYYQYRVKKMKEANK